MRSVNVFCSIAFLACALFAQQVQSSVLDPYNPTYEPNVILVKFKDNTSISKGLVKGVATTGISTIDNLNRTFEVESIEKVSRNAQPQTGKAHLKQYLEENKNGSPYLFTSLRGEKLQRSALQKIFKIWDRKTGLLDHYSIHLFGVC